MPYRMAHIDRAIVMTQYDLRGFDHPLGGRCEKGQSDKLLAATLGNFTAFASREKGEDPPADETYVSYLDGASFEQYLAMCKALARDCDGSQKEAIQLIILEIFKQGEEMKAVSHEPSMLTYLGSLDKDNRWGRAMLALSEAFEVKLELPVAA